MSKQDSEYFRPLWDGFDGELFQDLVCDLLSAEGYLVEPSGVGPDGGIDAFAQQLIEFGYSNPEPFLWAVQCKYSSDIEKSVSPREVGPIHNIVNDERFQSRDIKGFFLATNGRLSTNMMSELRGLNKSSSGTKTTYWDRSRIHDVLERNFSVYKKYFLPPQDDTEDDRGELPPTGPSGPLSPISAAELREFEDLINSPRTREVEIQAFLESYPSLLTLGEMNVDVRPEIVLESPKGVPLRPDFLVRSATSPLWDLIELKRPSVKIVTHKGGMPRPTAQIMQAIAQLKSYRDAFETTEIRERIEKQHGIHVYRPRLTLVAGRSADFSGEMERVKMQSQLPEVTIVTYDDLLEYARKQIKRIEK